MSFLPIFLSTAEGSNKEKGQTYLGTHLFFHITKDKLKSVNTYNNMMQDNFE